LLKTNFASFKQVGEKFLRKKAFKLRLYRVAWPLSGTICVEVFVSQIEVSPVKLRLHRVANADKLDKTAKKIAKK
jgi:hypothetical protein